MAFAAGTTIDTYEIVTPVGAGGPACARAASSRHLELWRRHAVAQWSSP
jgi:hypothetical protein